MAGFNLKEGEYEDREVSEDELWDAISCVFSTKSKNDSSYKFGLLKSIMDCLDNADKNLKITFDQIFTKFAEIYWNLILEYHLRQKVSTNDNRKSAIEKILLEARDKYGIDEVKSFDRLSTPIRNEVAHQVKMQCKKYVVGALFEDTKRLFYSFSKKGEWIQINSKMYDFICRHKVEIEKLNNYEWANFLEKVNNGISANTILNQYLLKQGVLYINTTEMLFEAEAEYKDSVITYQSREGHTRNITDEQSGEIDEEARALLDDPVELIKLLKKRRGI